VPAYVILHNSSLTEIARARPADVDALAAIGGIGVMKQERYGAAVIGLVAEDRADKSSQDNVSASHDNA
jgi:ATP-dependent DNA helicase RecQ